MGSVLTAKWGFWLLGMTGLAAAATVTACAGKALDVGADGAAGSGGASALGGTGSGATGVGSPAAGQGNLTYEGPRVVGAEWPDPDDCMPAPESPLEGPQTAASTRRKATPCSPLEA
jgi:hypothetical protein